MCLFCYLVLPNALLPATMSLLWGIMLSIRVLTVILPVVKVLGVDPIHFGIVMIICSSMGFLTPPVGVNLFVGCSIANISIERLSVAVMPFLVTMFLALLAITFIPQIALWLPGL